MENQPLVSIIIPTYNRAHLIGETLDSILAQTYQNWECIIVDDGSNDNTDDVVGSYVKKDNRFKYFHRPDEHLPGGNGARNYGFKMSQGEYVNWFDSDDLMLPEKLELKVSFILKFDLDIVVSNTININEKGSVDRPFTLFYSLPITPENFIKQRIGWITNDALIKKSIIDIRFNEHLKSGQEYNFFSNLLYSTKKINYIKKDLSLRKIHSESIQAILNLKNNEINRQLLFNEIHLLIDIYKKASKEIIKRSLKRIFRLSIETTSKYKIPKHIRTINIFLATKNSFLFLVNYNSWVFFNYFTGKGYFFYRFFSKVN